MKILENGCKRTKQPLTHMGKYHLVYSQYNLTSTIFTVRRMKFNESIYGCTLDPQHVPARVRPVIENLYKSTSEEVKAAMRRHHRSPGWIFEDGWWFWLRCHLHYCLPSIFRHWKKTSRFLIINLIIFDHLQLLIYLQSSRRLFGTQNRFLSYIGPLQSNRQRISLFWKICSLFRVEPVRLNQKTSSQSAYQILSQIINIIHITLDYMDHMDY